MSKPLRRANLALLSLFLSGATFASGNTPITNERTALRSVLTGFVLADDVPGQIVTLGQDSRDVVDRGLRQLAAATTPAALGAAADGIEIPCGVSGTLRARMPLKWPRVVQFEWTACASSEFGGVSTLNGPGEVVFTGNSFTPAAIVSLRLGDRTRDVTLDSPIVGNPSYGGSRLRWNLRATGVLPMTRQYEYGLFVGRYAYETTGFYERTSFITSYPDPGPPFYAQVQTLSADGVFVAGNYTFDATSGDTRETRVFRGTLSVRLDAPATPRHGARTYAESVRLNDLRLHSTSTWAPDVATRRVVTIDGQAEADIGQYWGFPGCTQPETFTWRTREALSNELSSYVDFYDRGELAVNDNVIAKFRQTGTEPYVDLLGHIDIGLRGAGNFGFAAQYSTLDLATEAGCTP